MAHLMLDKSHQRYRPRTESVPPTREVVRARNAYGWNNSGQFPFGPASWDRQGVRLPETLFPRSVHIQSGTGALPDAINAGGFLGCSQRLKDVIEELEPGVHQFHPVPVTVKAGERTPTTYYATVLGRALVDQVVLEQSTMKRSNGGGFAKVDNPSLWDGGKIAIDRSLSSGWHVWISWDLYTHWTCSDELKARLDAAKISCFDYIELRQING
ncbi:hypothetical protein BH11PSE6_BH11PSE6_01030 [soil metagenome]